jgi:DNA polymerase-3 subunit epsilon
VRRVNPGIPIPRAVTEIHGIFDADVAGEPPFSEYADEVLERIREAALFGYNVIFDFNVLSQEMVRAKRGFLDPKKWVLLDPFVIWKRHDPKTLEHALKVFCGREHPGAHGALADVDAAFDVLNAQLGTYEDLPGSVPELGGYCYPGDPSWVCSSYHFVWDDRGEIICNFGKNKRMSLKDLADKQRSFCEWILKREFPEDVKELVKKALKGAPLPEKKQ